jgi:hypothetical protein
MEMAKQEDRVEFKQIYLHGDSLSFEHGLKITAQVGLGSLCIFSILFKERFEIIRIRSVIDRLRAQL